MPQTLEQAQAMEAQTASDAAVASSLLFLARLRTWMGEHGNTLNGETASDLGVTTDELDAHIGRLSTLGFISESGGTITDTGREVGFADLPKPRPIFGGGGITQ